MNRIAYNVKVLGKSVDKFDNLEQAREKLGLCKILGLDAKIFKEQLELQEDPVVLDKVWKVVQSEQVE